MKFNTDNTDLELDIDSVIVAGWTGRNKDAVDHHIQELADIGIAPPSACPLYYRVSNSLLTQGDKISVLGNGTSGEVEPLLVNDGKHMWLGLGSDHTDRDLERHSVASSKQACPKPVASELWNYSEVAEHSDSLELESWILENNEWVQYQQGTLAAILPLSDLIEQSHIAQNSAMLCGTVPAIGGIRMSTQFKMKLSDPVLKRYIECQYGIFNLPVVS